ncbi:unnamed protein product [Brugia pahangi]|uniref:Lipocln_cytosolic_FA-bd_dom domain-containing protein n=1 Tax=Brugia pahangi TaxID=6280 RepID=A0A0N4T4Q3_BRUPA|nr:unnamed protein product [Brugia pahangi]
MTKLVVYLAFIIFCNRQQNQQGMGAVVAPISIADVITGYKAEILWDDDLLIATTQVEESTMMNCDTMEDGRLFVLEEKPFGHWRQLDQKASGTIRHCKSIWFIEERAGQNVRRAAAGGVGAKIVTDYKADKLWDDDLLMETTQVQESIMTNCDTMKDGRLFILEEKPLLLMANTVC